MMQNRLDGDIEYEPQETLVRRPISSSTSTKYLGHSQKNVLSMELTSRDDRLSYLSTGSSEGSPIAQEYEQSDGVEVLVHNASPKMHLRTLDEGKTSTGETSKENPRKTYKLPLNVLSLNVKS